ncbi:MAG: L,D-transpeptidase [Thermovirgaceae bacterium]
MRLFRRRPTVDFRRKSPWPRRILLLFLVAAVAGLGVYLAKTQFGAIVSVLGEKEPARTVTEKAKMPELPPEYETRVLQVVNDKGLQNEYWLWIVKKDFTLSAFRGTERVAVYEIAIGENPGDKQEVGDCRTPEGIFTVESLHDSSAWVHDFGDGPVEGAYGPWFIRLKTGWKGIGIHGTHDPSTLGTTTTEGCIRVRNEHLLEVVENVEEGSVVVIDP